jgi:hypothetical protein
MGGRRLRRTWGKLDLTKIRHPREREVLLRSILANAAVVVGAVALVYLAPEYLVGHTRAVRLIERIRVAVAAAIVLLPSLAFLRLGRWAAFRHNSVRLGPDQVPEIYEILERQCRAVGVEPPEVYVSTLPSVGISTALARGRGRRVIVLGKDLFSGLGGKIADRTSVLEFVLAHELGRLALGHASWWEDLLLGYLKRIPVLRMPLLKVQTFSRDRFAATLAPRGIRALVLLAAGGDLLKHVDLRAYLREILRDETPPLWTWVGQLGRDEPHLSHRVHELYRSGFFDLERDLALTSAPAEAPGDGADEEAFPPPR